MEPVSAHSDQMIASVRHNVPYELVSSPSENDRFPRGDRQPGILSLGRSQDRSETMSETYSPVILSPG